MALWHNSELGRGAAMGFSHDAFNAVNFSQPYFDPRGLIFACDGPEVIGFVHAGFACDASEARLSHQTGVICAVVVQPQRRRQGIGRELVARAEDYLKDAGATTVFAGPSEERDPFFFGLYGGVQPAGFLESDPHADPFFQAIGYEPAERYSIFQCDVASHRGPSTFSLASLRRKTELDIDEQPENPTWWWLTRTGRLDSLRFRLVPKGGGPPFAALTVLGLDFYISRWQERAAGFIDLSVFDSDRPRDYVQLLLIESVRRLRQELVTRVEIHASDADADTTSLCEATGFTKVDAGVVYRRGSAPENTDGQTQSAGESPLPGPATE